MAKYTTFIIILLLSVSNCTADTFTNLLTGQKFNGYAVQRKKGEKTQVRIENSSPEYLDLKNYRIERNYLGRKNKVYSFSITNPVDLIAVVDAFEEEIVTAANQGPLFILIEIDTPGGRIDLVQRICTAILNIDNCTTVAFINDAKYGGAYSQAAIIALSCDEIYMRTGSGIGSALSYTQTNSNIKALEEIYDRQTAEQMQDQWLAFCRAVAQKSERPEMLIRAMVEENLGVIEVVENGKHYLINASDQKANQTVVRIWSKSGSLLALTAEQAVECGIADGVVSSQKQLIDDLDAETAQQIPDRTMLKERREFEKARQQFDKIYSNISSLKERSDDLLKQIDQLEERIRKLDPIYYRYRSFHWTGAPNQEKQSSVVNMQIERYTAMTKRDGLLDQLTVVLNYLVLNYNQAIPLAQNNKDLHHYTKDLEEGLETALTTYRDISTRPRLNYNW